MALEHSKSNLGSILVALIICLFALNSKAQLKANSYDTTNDVGVKILIGTQIGSSNYVTSIIAFPGMSVTVNTNGSVTLVNNNVVTNNYQLGFTNVAGIYFGTNDSRFVLFDDTGRITNFPVAVFRPSLTNISMILDLMPTGDNNFTNINTSFITGIDLVNRDLDNVPDKTNFQVLRLALVPGNPGAAVIGSSNGGTNDAPLVIFQAGTNTARPFSFVYRGVGGTVVTQAWFTLSGTLFVSNGITGTVAGAAPLTGTVGEFMAVTNNFGTGTNLTTGLDTNALKLTLTAGDWSVVGHATFASGTATAKGTQIKASIGLVNNSVNADGTQVYSWPAVTNNAFTASVSLSTPVRVNVTTSTNVYMNANATFTAGTWVVYGEMEATRIR